AGGHEKISTGKAGDKFGVSMATAEALWPRMAGMDGLTPRGLAVHIGSQIADPAKFSAAFERLAALADRLSDPTPAEIDLGGGFGVDYGAGGAIDLAAYVGVVRRWFGHGRYRLTVEPGRALTADAGALLTRVIRWKQDDGRAFMIVDAAMSDFLRPALYGAEHEVIAAGDGAGIRTGDLVGPVCETADLFRRGAALPDTPAGGVIALCGVGAYGAAMANAYNARALPAEVMVRGAEHVLLRPPFDHSRMMALEQTPEWSQPSG
ncbi:MAG: diaminopimelate decarboxylase, partial [Pseudomonadota bacterium]